MQISVNLLRVIFMLSTIVTVTDCCSSRILFFREETFNIIQQQKMEQYQQNDGHSQAINEKFEQHIDSSGNSGAFDKIYNKNHTSVNADDETSSDEQNNAEGSSTDNVSHLDKPPPDKDEFAPSEATPQMANATDESEERDQFGDSKGIQLSDIYLNIMNDVLSFACTGQFLTEFCLNGGRCFRYPVGNQSFFSCECADGYVGERCESKSVNGVFVPTSTLDPKQPKILTARVVFSYPMLIFLSVVYLFFGMAIVLKCQPPFRSKYAPTTSRAAGLLFT